MDEKTKYVEKFKLLYKKKTQKELNDLEALHYFENLINLVENIYQPITKEKI